MLLTVLTVLHVLLSLAAIGAGLIVLQGLLTSRSPAGWTFSFLSTSIATSVTGFLFPVHRLLPSHVLGILSLVALGIAVLAQYRRRLQGGWRRAYAITAVIALYFNVFVLIAQLFMKVPFLEALAPTQTEPPFAGAELITLLLFSGLGFLAASRFREQGEFRP